jgi:hypothetical protein
VAVLGARRRRRRAGDDDAGRARVRVRRTSRSRRGPCSGRRA